MTPSAAHATDPTPAPSEWQATHPSAIIETALAGAEARWAEGADDEAMSLDDRLRRDDLVRFCVRKLRMTVPQVWEFSRSWPWPYYDQRAVRRRLEPLKLDGRVRRVSEQSLHDHWTFKVSLKIWQDAIRHRISVTEIEKECRIGQGTAIRADMQFRLNERLFYLETQQSALTFRGWKHKLSKYVAYRTRRGVRPFRVLIVMENERNLNTVYRYCREVTQSRPHLSLFLLAWQNDLLGHHDVCSEKVWVSNLMVGRRPQTVSLLG